VQRDFWKYTAQRIKHDLYKYHPELLSHFIADEMIEDTIPIAVGIGKAGIKY
jgi:hypothetical protein